MQRRPAGQSDGSDNLSATLAADRAFPAAVAEFVRRHYAHLDMQRGILPDALKDDAVMLIKSCPELRLTYELRVAAFMAQQTRRRLLVVTTVDCTTSPALQAFAREHMIVIQRHKYESLPDYFRR